MSRLIRAVIDTSALRHNLNVIRARAGRSRVIAVVKANAYGHGLVSAALAIQDAGAYAVARLEEGMTLRAAGITSRVLLLEGVFSRSQLEDAAHDQLDLVVHDARQIELLEQTGGAAPLRAVDQDRHRHEPPGVLAARISWPRSSASACSRPRPREIRLMTHLACADERDGAETRAQLIRFAEATAGT